jgi:hypothetical protein
MFNWMRSIFIKERNYIISPSLIQDIKEGDLIVLKTDSLLSAEMMGRLKEVWSQYWKGREFQQPKRLVVLEPGISVGINRIAGVPPRQHDPLL